MDSGPTTADDVASTSLAASPLPYANDDTPDGGGDERQAAWRTRLARLADTTDGSAAAEGVVTLADRVEAFGPAILAIRWSTTMASVALVASLSPPSANDVAWCLVIIAYAAIRTARPIRYIGNVASIVAVVAEIALHLIAVAATGSWDSPLIFSLLNAISVAGFARGFGFGLRIGVASAMAVTILHLSPEATAVRIRESAQWTLMLLLVGLIAGYARHISGEADRQHTLALDRLGRLADANALLFSLHRITQTLPASLDLDDVLDTTIARLRGLFEFDFAAVLLTDDTDGSVWHLARREGTRLPLHLTTRDLPPPLARALTDSPVVSCPSLPSAGGPGLAGRASSGLYAVLPARGSVIGLLAVEHQAERHFTSRDAELLRGFVDSVALAIDNARWFARLRTVGADEERTRIARDLHDRIGQSLAYLAFELDRIVATAERGEPLGSSLEQLRDDVRGVIREVRDTLYDLRTDVSDSQDLPSVLEAFIARVQERSDLSIELVCDRSERLPLLQEREMWRIAQEAITNVERHARARRVRVVWRCNGDSATLDITDDGQGFPIGRAGRLDSYGILGMRERASSIGATLEIASEPDKGTRVRAVLIRSDSDGDNR